MKVSVVIPTYNRKLELKKTLDGLSNQDYKNFEIIIVDDGSEDNTKSLIKNLKIKNLKYFRQENKGPAAARNLGIKKSSGDIIVFTDDDCLPTKNWLKNIISPFNNPKVIGVEGKTITSKVTPFTNQVENLNGSGFQTCNMAYRKRDLLEVNGFDENYPYAFNEDVDLAFKILKNNGLIIFNNKAIVYHPALKDKVFFNRKRIKKHLEDFRLYRKFPKLYKKYKAKNPYSAMIKFALIRPIKIIIKHKRYFSKNPLNLIIFIISSILEGTYILINIIFKIN